MRTGYNLSFRVFLPMVLPVVLLMLVSVVGRAQDKTDNSKGRFYFRDGEQHDLGTVRPSMITNDTFWFENMGLSPIFINYVSSTNGLFVPDWTREAVRPGQIGYVCYALKAGKKAGPLHCELFIQSDAANKPNQKAYRLNVFSAIGKEVAKPAKKKRVAHKPAAAKK